MALASTSQPQGSSRIASLPLGEAASIALTLAGALMVIAGSYMAWATFYAGLIARNGVPGHGKYFIALAVVAVVSAAVSRRNGLSLLRLIPAAAGIIIAATAARDIRNIEALIGDPAAAFYAPGLADGLYVVIAGALLLVASVLPSFRASLPSRSDVPLLAVALTLIAAIGALVAGGYGEYYLHLASGGHQHGHTDTMNPAHLLTFGGGALLLIGLSAGMYLIGSARTKAPPPV